MDSLIETFNGLVVELLRSNALYLEDLLTLWAVRVEAAVL